ncbi:MAG: MFS transporter [Roseateles sp.]|nr:MAG: MFS transporter [Roseateles sp.]
MRSPALSADRPATRWATRLAFWVSGFGMACWAPLVPFAKQRLGVDDTTLGLLLLCLGLGSVAAMPVAGRLCVRHGSRPLVLGCGLGLAWVLPGLSLASSPWALGGVLVLFGALLGAMDVAMNVHAVAVEQAAGRPLMSGFHGCFSVGGFAGAGLMTLLLSHGWPAPGATLGCAALMALGIALAWPRLLRGVQGAEADEVDAPGPGFALPRGVVLLLACLAAISFLAEGAMLDWGALWLTESGLAASAQGGLGFIGFSLAMTLGRFGGDALTARIGDRRTLQAGGLLAFAGLVLLLSAPVLVLALAGFVLIGLGASNVVPVLFRRAGAQPQMPPALAIAAVTTLGYAGILLGPALIGWVSGALGLRVAFGLLALLLLALPLSARAATLSGTR